MVALQLDAYIRVSRVGGRSGESFISTAAQRERIAKFADAKGFRIAEWHEELDQPGSRADRPKLQEALSRIDTGATGGIIVAKLDRFARSVADAAIAIRRIHEAGGQLVSVEDGFDSTTPMGRFATNMILALAELELGRIRESWATAQEHAVRRGVHVASRAPTGYVRGSDRRLELDSLAAPAIAAAFEARAGEASLKEVAAGLMKRGVVGPYGNEHWTSWPRGIRRRSGSRATARSTAGRGCGRTSN